MLRHILKSPSKRRKSTMSTGKRETPESFNTQTEVKKAWIDENDQHLGSPRTIDVQTGAPNVC
jgi:hypothetical protein